MSFLKNIFGNKKEQINSYEEFWDWFKQNQKSFYEIVKSRKNIERDFFDKLSPKLAELKEGYFFLTGMFDDNTAELILTADGNAKNVVFVEELVNDAPQIEGWKITAHKRPVDIDNLAINMGDYSFSADNLYFYANDNAAYPDEIDIKVVHDDLNEENRNEVANGTYIFLDNYLGEIDFLTTIDNLKIIGKKEVEKELVPISKLKDFLNWRQKEFIEKYEGIRYDTEHDSFSLLEAELKSGNKLLAVVNTELLNWDSKASHPWVCIIIFKFDGKETNGMPNDHDYKLLNEIEDEMLEQLKDKEGNLNIGRQTAESERELYFACNDFRKASKVFYEFQLKYKDKFEIEIDIFKDKYWQSYEKFT
ncbi:DUF695 domain-containing protein [Flavobacterium ardleyense]|uniref:DUF695 domain-containing protein n=1 Tax=Flavobacterium ardleyense TaxID=2038737 RepID=A0ABW5Z9P0_9FLAO